MIRWSLLLVFAIKLIQNVCAQDYQFKKVWLEDGLSQSSINAVAQDQKGFLWLGTQDGLNRYDGHQFKIFKNIPFDSTSLAENFISSLLVDAKGRLWVGTMNMGLHLYDPKTNTFTRFQHDPNRPQTISNNTINCLYEDKNHTIWIGTNNGFNQVKFTQNEVHFKYYQHQPNLPRTFPTKHFIRSIFHDSKGNLWVGSNKGLYQYKLSKEGLTLTKTFKQNEAKKTNILKNIITSIAEDRQQRLWVGSRNGVTIFEKGQFSPIDLMKHEDREAINDIMVDKKGNIWIATLGGIFIKKYNQGSYATTFERHQQSVRPNGLHANMISKIHEDNRHEGLYWLGTFLGGVSKMYYRSKRFMTNHLTYQNIPDLVSNSVRLLLKDRSNVVWIGTDAQLLRYDRPKENYRVFRKIKIVNESNNYLHPHEMLYFYKDSKNQLWTSSYRGLFKLLRQSDGSLVAKLFQFKEEKSAIYTIFEADNRLYLGTWQGIGYLDLKTEQLNYEVFKIDTINNQKYRYSIRNILKDKSNNYWIGTTHGLVLYRSVKGTFWEHIQKNPPEIYQHNMHNPKSLTNDRLTALYEDGNGTIWLGTHSALVKVKMKPNTLIFKAFGERQGLANNLVYEIAGAGDYFWVSTNKGLSRFNVIDEKFDNFDIKDGLQSNEFNGNAYHQAEDGELFFGGISGYTSFYPDEIALDCQSPQVWITALSVEDTTYNLLADSSKTIQLSYTHNNFNVQFIGIDYLYPDDISYFYQLETEGTIVKRRALGNSQQVDFTKLGSGKYVLRILAKNRDGAMNRTGDAMSIEIAAPYWQTWWFYGLIVLVIGGLFWMIYHIRYLTKMQKIAEIEKVRKNAAQDFHDELGSKLTVITMFSELTKSRLNGNYEEVAPYLDKVSGTANSLYHSMKDLIWALNPEQDSVQDLYLQLKDFGDELFDQTGVEFNSEGLEAALCEKTLPMEYKRHILLIFKELMNNSLKHSDCTEATLRMYNGDGKLKIEFKDNGIGFNVTDTYDGDGLKNIYNRANKIESKIKICSNNRGTAVTLKCDLSLN